MEIAHIEGLTITVCPFCKIIISANGLLDELDKSIDTHFTESLPCQKAHDELPILTEALAELHESLSGHTVHGGHNRKGTEKMESQIQIGLEVWVHSGDVPEWDWFNITGENIHSSLVEYLLSKDRQSDVDKFDKLPKETACYTILLMSFEEGDESVGLSSGWYVEKLFAFQTMTDPYAKLNQQAQLL